MLTSAMTMVAIFDLGGVLFAWEEGIRKYYNWLYKRSLTDFHAISQEEFVSVYYNPIYFDFLRGHMDFQQFCNDLRRYLRVVATDEEIYDALENVLAPMESNLLFLNELRQLGIPTLVCSDIHEVHLRKYQKMSPGLIEGFLGGAYSHKVGAMKMDGPQMFERVEHEICVKGWKECRRIFFEDKEEYTRYMPDGWSHIHVKCDGDCRQMAGQLLG